MTYQYVLSPVMRQDLFPNMGKNWKAWVHSILRKHTLFPLQGGEHWMCNIPPLPSEMWHKTQQVRNSEGKLEFSPELAPSAHRNPVFIKLIQNIWPLQGPQQRTSQSIPARHWKGNRGSHGLWTSWILWNYAHLRAALGMCQEPKRCT